MTSSLAEARNAYSRRDWPRARALFAAARAGGERLSADDLYAWSDAAWWVGDNEAVLEAGAGAYRAYLDEDRPARAAITALDMAMVLMLRGDQALGSGWIRRSQRLLDGRPRSVEHGYLRYLLEVEGRLGGVVSSAEPVAHDDVLTASRQIQEVARRHGDATLAALGTLGEGRALVRLGRVHEGLALLDEAMLDVLGDDLAPVWAGNIYCQLMAAAHELADVRRAREWTAAAARWLGGLADAVVYHGICRVHRSQVSQASGDWDLAEQEASRVCADLAGIHRTAVAEAHYQVGEVRRLRGDHARAEDAYREAHAHGRDPQPGLALLRLAQGRPATAAESIRAALLGETTPLARVRLLAAQVEIALAVGDIEAARGACDELHRIAAAYPGAGVEAAAGHALGSLLLADGDAVGALASLRDACDRWNEAAAPYECARVRVVIAQACRALGDEDAAARELDAAADVFDRLGARPDSRALAGMRARPKPPAGLSPREVEVLALVSAGMSNREVAAKLVISERTVGRHLSNIYTKLGVSTRTAAAAFAFDHDLPRRAKAGG